MIPCVIALAIVVIMHWKSIMDYDKKFGYDGLFEALNMLIGKKGFITEMGGDILRWFKIGFHPNDI